MSFDVELLGVTKRFGKSTAVDGVSFSVESGSFFSLLGPSGCGKSTTLRMLGGFEHPDEGTIRITGQDMAGVAPYRRPANVVFQRLALFPHMTVEQNIAFGLEAEGRPRAEIRTRVGEALELVSLAGLSARKPGQISGGQMQRVALARALVKRPRVILLDEPLSALDLKLRHQMQFELKRIQQEVGMTFIFVTHDQGEALNMSDRVGVMNRGRLEQVATPQELYDKPATPFIARFVGNANSLPVDVLEIRESKATVRLWDKAFDCDIIENPGQDKAQILVRWERVTIGPLAAALPFHARGLVRDVVFSGAVVQYVIAVDGCDQTILAERSHHGSDALLNHGVGVEFGWDANAARLVGQSHDH